MKLPRVIVSVIVLNALPIASPTSKSSTTVTFTSPCAAKGTHGVDRWAAKTDHAPIPAKSKITAVTPSQIYNWPGPGPNVPLTRKSKRIASEQKWYAVTGRVDDVRVEADGDIHIGLKDVSGNKAGHVGVEIPSGPGWCNLRKTAFAWTTRKFPFHFTSGSKLTLSKKPVIIATGKAFFDVDHAPKDHSNRKTTPAGYAAWEIHPVMSLSVEH